MGECHRVMAVVESGALPPARNRMQVLVRSNDPVRLSFLIALLRDAGIEAVLLDGQMSVVEGSIGAIPRRLMVEEDLDAMALYLAADASRATTGSVFTVDDGQTL